MDARDPASDSSPWMPFESRRRARDEKRDAVLRTAVQLFLEQGYHRATLNEVAERLNITKPALYNYFRGKEDILFECWALGQERVDDFIAGIDAAGGTGLAKLRKLIHAYAEVMTTDYGASLVRFDPRPVGENHQAVVARKFTLVQIGQVIGVDHFDVFGAQGGFDDFEELRRAMMAVVAKKKDAQRAGLRRGLNRKAGEVCQGQEPE